MAYFQAFDPQLAAFNATDLYTCRIVVPYAHKLVSATLYTQNVVHTGTVTVTLKKVDPNGGRGGARIGTALNNTTLGAQTSMTSKIPFVLGTDDVATAPANRMYFLVLTATNAADRVDEPVLIIEVDQV